MSNSKPSVAEPWGETALRKARDMANHHPRGENPGLSSGICSRHHLLDGGTPSLHLNGLWILPFRSAPRPQLGYRAQDQGRGEGSGWRSGRWTVMRWEAEASRGSTVNEEERSTRL